MLILKVTISVFTLFAIKVTIVYCLKFNFQQTSSVMSMYCVMNIKSNVFMCIFLPDIASQPVLFLCAIMKSNTDDVFILNIEWSHLKTWVKSDRISYELYCTYTRVLPRVAVLHVVLMLRILTYFCRIYSLKRLYYKLHALRFVYPMQVKLEEPFCVLQY